MHNGKLVPYEKIEKACKGDIHSINWIVDHYTPYMKAIATIECYSEDGRKFHIVDEELLGRIKIKLIKRILKFNPIPFQKIQNGDCLC